MDKFLAELVKFSESGAFGPLGSPMIFVLFVVIFTALLGTFLLVAIEAWSRVGRKLRLPALMRWLFAFVVPRRATLTRLMRKLVDFLSAGLVVGAWVGEMSPPATGVPLVRRLANPLRRVRGLVRPLTPGDYVVAVAFALYLWWTGKNYPDIEAPISFPVVAGLVIALAILIAARQLRARAGTLVSSGRISADGFSDGSTGSTQNISSVASGGTGQLTIVWNRAYADLDYHVSITPFEGRFEMVSKSVGSVSIRTYNHDGNPEDISIDVHAIGGA